MNVINKLIKHKVKEWIRFEKENNQSIIKVLLNSIDKVGKLRLPQKEAIETYLWIKFVGKNKKLSNLVKEGFFYDDEDSREYDNYYTFKDTKNQYTNQFLNQFFIDNAQKELQRKLINDPNSEKVDWDKFFEDLLHNFNYSNYLYSLPMGTGKTFLMACFIYIDLYFANLFKNDKRFSHNFIVFAPHSSKTAILPSLKTIKDFNPEWIFPEKDAKKMKQIITIEILDSLSSKRKDKLHGNNPNLEKVNRLKQTKDFGLVFITNAEKVVLEKYQDKDKSIIKFIKKDQGDLYKQENEIKRTNELRNALSQIPHTMIILDEVHHSYGNNGKGEKKLRKAVDILNQNQNITTVLGLSGTPYVKNKINVADENIRLNQIQDIVYSYPLNKGIGKFLKKPDIRKVSVIEEDFIQQALFDFFKDYNLSYKNGTQSKIAFYCPSIKVLNEKILPTIQDWYLKNRKGKEEEIFKYYSNVGKENKQYALSKDSLSIFNNLDKSYSKKRVILLVAIGKEGWDCKSLTAVVLPRQKTAKNFVLQTTCRCLREVDNAKEEKALIYLSEDNYETLDKELKDNYQLSISDLMSEDNQSISVQVRKPKLGILKYKQIEIKYKIIKRIYPEIKKGLESFDFNKIKDKYYYDKSIYQGKVGSKGIIGEKVVGKIENNAKKDFSLKYFIYLIANEGYGLINESEIENKYIKSLEKICDKIKKEIKWVESNPFISMKQIIQMITNIFMDKVEYTKEIIKKETKIELLEWEGEDNQINIISSNRVDMIMPKIPKENLSGRSGYIKKPENIEQDLFQEDNVDPQDISYNYVPYKMDSEFERNALEEILKLQEMKDLEVYFNGYKDDQLQSFWIQTPRGKYTPDFLILKRKENKKYKKNQDIVIDKIIIVETKGSIYYNDEFKAKEMFIKEEFLNNNKHFTYHCFIDEGKNDFKKHIDKLKEIVKAFKNE